ncbi:MAG: hypothetical protein M3O99_00025 [Chloroflexota bacterium]|nr:hypothetical protein [Chloroflexota bacterium]
MAIAATASHAPSPVSVARVTPDQRDANTDERPEILEEDDDDLRRLGDPKKLPPGEATFR